MEARSEGERFEHGNLPRQAPLTPEQIALRALIDHLEQRKPEGA